MIGVFKILNQFDAILKDEFGDDVLVKEDGSAKFESVEAKNITGTLTTSSQPNITSFGTLTSLNVDNIRLDGSTISTTNTNGNLILSPNGTGIIQVSKNLSMGFHRLIGEVISRPFLSLSVENTTSQGQIIWSSSIQNPDFETGNFGLNNLPHIQFPALGYYRVTCSATFKCSNVEAPERVAFIEFRKSNLVLASASDQIIKTESGDVFGNAAFNKIIQIDDLGGLVYYFNWGTLPHAVGTLTSQTHGTIERVG